MTATLPTDLQDERLRTEAGIGANLRASIARVRGGDLGLIPVIAGLAIIWTIFQALNPYFLSSANLTNLLMESAPVGVIALGIVFVLLVGEIDLSVGSVSGLSAAIMGITFVDHGLPLALAMAASVGAAVVIGIVYGLVYNRVGVPSFVVTLAGLLGFLGLQLFVLGPKGTINIPFDSPLVKFGQLAFVPAPVAYGLAVLAAAAVGISGFARARTRRRAGLSAAALSLIVTRAVLLLVVLVLAVAVAYLYQARGVGWMFVFFVALVLVANYFDLKKSVRVEQVKAALTRENGLKPLARRD